MRSALLHPRVVVIAWSILLVGSLLWPLAGHGVLLHRDMAILDHPALSRAAWGFGDLPARNAPQDGLLALIGTIVPASWCARCILLGGGLAGAYGAYSLTRYLHDKPGFPLSQSRWNFVFPALAAVTVTIFNPFVVERLLQGQWSLVICAWLLPGIVAWGLTGEVGKQFAALWLASLTPTGAVVATLCAIAVATSRRARVSTAVWGLFVSLPWLIPSVLEHVPAKGDAAMAFAPRAETGTGTLGALLGLGGIWNSDAVPASREQGFAIAGIALFVVLLTSARRVPVRLLVLAGVALGLTLLLTTAPALAQFVVANVPGAALFRDSHKLVLFLIPAYAALAAALRPRALAIGAICLSLLQVWDAPHAVGVLAPTQTQRSWQALADTALGRDVFAPDARPIITFRDDVVVNPLTKAVSLVEDGSLIVDGTLVDAPSPRFQAASELWQNRDLEGLKSLDIGLVVTKDEQIDLGGSPNHGWPYWLGLSLTLWWMLLPLATLLACYFVQQRGKLRAR